MVKENFELLEQPRFEWDEEKSKTNLIKRGIDFEDASEVFLRADPHQRVEPQQ
jgi:uncharacterized DUF497 family protein